MGIRVHLFELGRDNPAGAEDDEMVLFRFQDLRDNRPDQLVAGACTVGFPDRTGHEDRDLLWRHIILIDDVPVRLLELRQVERGVRQQRIPAVLCSRVLSPPMIVPDQIIPAMTRSDRTSSLSDRCPTEDKNNKFFNIMDTCS